MDDETNEAAAAIMMENSSTTMADERGYGNGFWEFSRVRNSTIFHVPRNGGSLV